MQGGLKTHILIALAASVQNTDIYQLNVRQSCQRSLPLKLLWSQYGNSFFRSKSLSRTKFAIE